VNGICILFHFIFAFILVIIFILHRLYGGRNSEGYTGYLVAFD